MIRCMFCGTKLSWQSDYDASDMGYDCEGVVGCYSCMNEECNVMYEIIDLYPNVNSKYYELYGDRHIKYYHIDFEE